MRTPLLVLLCVVPWSACVYHEGSATMPEDDQAIRVLADRFAAAFVTGDPEAAARCVTADFIAMTPGEPAISGRAAVVEKIVRDLEQMDVRELIFEVEEVHAVGDWAWARATSRAEVALRDSGRVVRIRGKTLWVFRRGVDGAWRIARDASSGDDV